MNQTDPLAVNDYWERHNSLSDVIKVTNLVTVNLYILHQLSVCGINSLNAKLIG